MNARVCSLGSRSKRNKPECSVNVGGVVSVTEQKLPEDSHLFSLAQLHSGDSRYQMHQQRCTEYILDLYAWVER